jgi:hypothetical protein
MGEGAGTSPRILTGLESVQCSEALGQQIPVRGTPGDIQKHLGKVKIPLHAHGPTLSKISTTKARHGGSPL